MPAMFTKFHVARPAVQVIRRRSGALALAMCACLGLTLSVQPAFAQTYPAKPVRLIVPYPAGGPADILARLLSQKLSTKWGQQVIVDNRGGANTIIGMEAAARAAPDGYTLVLATTALSINAGIVPKLPYDTAKDFTAITNLVSASFVMVVHPSVPARDLKEFIALAKSKPGLIVFGSGGTGSPTHVSGELFDSMAGVKLVHAPYRGMAPAVTDLLAGHISVLFSDPLVMLPYVKEGRVRALGVTSSVRFPSAPEIPTLSEAGLPGYESGIWYGVVGPTGMPRPIVNTIHNALVESLKEPDVQERLAKLGTTTIGDDPDHFAAFLQADMAKWIKATAGQAAADAAATK
jgi:tripartite-type tricarboxylate transporter receptor subunit TctC